MTAEDKKSDWAQWDDEKAQELLGKLVIVGMTRLSARGILISQKQIYGRVTLVDQVVGITIKLEGSKSGEVFVLPPSPRTFIEAPPGEYRLRETGEIVVNPDFTSTWTSTDSERN